MQLRRRSPYSRLRGLLPRQGQKNRLGGISTDEA